MRNLFYRKVKKRTSIIVFFFVLWLLILVVRLVQLQVINHSRLKAKVLEQNQNIDVIYPKRGTVYSRTGTILACSIPRDSVFITPYKEEPLQIHYDKIAKLKNVIKLSSSQVKNIRIRIQKNAPFIWIKRKITPEESKKIKALHLDGVHLTEESMRFYPQGKLAAHIIGKTGIDENGLSGIEYKYNDILQGKEGERLILKDAKKREYRFKILKAAVAGMDIVSTIDETIQYIAEKELEWAVRNHKADWGTVIVCQPSTGEILGMAHYPTANLNHLSDHPFMIDRIKAVHYTFAPGSMFKTITAAAALESHSVELTDSFDCSQGSILVSGRTIRDHHKFGILSFPEVIIHSSNVGTVQVSQKIDEKYLFNMIKKFGFGEKTGIDLPAEEKGIFHPYKKWSRNSYAFHSIGYEISVTPIQVLHMVNTIANKGLMIEPRIIKKFSSDPGSNQEDSPAFRRILIESTAIKIIKILEQVIQQGTGKSAQIPGFPAAGKTGTSQKIDPDTGTYTSEAHIASFVGFVPSESPEISIIVVIDNPRDNYYGGDVAAPVFSRIGTQVLRYLGVQPLQKTSSHLIARHDNNKGVR